MRTIVSLPALGFCAATIWAVPGPSVAQQAAEPADQVLPAFAPAAEPAVPLALSPLGQAVRTSLMSTLPAGSTALDFYATRGFEPFWIGADGAVSDQAITLLAFLDRAGEHALPERRYGAERLRASLTRAGAAPGQIAGLEASLTDAYLKYARDVSSGLLEPQDVDPELHVFPRRPDPATLLRQASTQPMQDHLAGLAPSDPAYVRLMRHYASFRTIARAGLWGPEIARGQTLRPGDRGRRVAALRTRLIALGDLSPAVASGAHSETVVATAETANDAAAVPGPVSNVFDAELVEAVRRFQIRHGLNPDGAVGPATLDAINTGPEKRIEQIVVNLERLRWLNHDLGERHILVNLASFTVDVMRGETSEFHSRTVIGKAQEHQTPEFSDEMTYMVVNPSWYVPTSIAVKEIMPKVARDPNYLAKRNMRLTGPNRIVQGPGPGNALGRVKFMFPNRFAIYLHDTPSRRLFSRDMRAYSHGCVRVAKPLELAAYLLQGQEADPEGAFNRWLRQGRERHVNLDNPLPVHITYRTAWVAPDGTDNFRGDIYGRDATVAQALQGQGVTFTR